MASVYRCSCGKAYNLEEGKKYKCKNCGAIMELAATAPVASAAPAAAKPASPKSGAPTPRTGAGAKPSVRPSQRAAGASAGTRPSLRSRQGEEGDDRPPVKKKKTGLYIGIGIGAAALLALIFMMGGGEEEKKVDPAQAAQAKKMADEKASADAAAAKAAAAKKREKKKLSKEEFDDLVAQIKKGDQARDINALHAIFQKIKDENIDLDRKPLHYAILHIDPQDKMVTDDIGAYERNRLNYDEMKARVARGEEKKDVKILYDAVQWVFDNNLYSPNGGLDYIQIYKAIHRVDPNDYEGRVAAPKVKDADKAPYTGPAQEYKGKLLQYDEFQAAKEIEWKLHKETGIPFLPTEGGGSKGP